MTRGMVAGRFLPLHAGHVALIRTAQTLVDQLTVAVVAATGDPVPTAVRRKWIVAQFPDARVIVIEGLAPTNAGKTEELAAHIRGLHPEPIELLFASDSSQEALARALPARLVLIDPDHAAIPVRSAEVRDDPLGKWTFLPPAVRPFYASTICLHGPESTGKTTLVRRLADYFGTIYVPEYGRTYCEQFGLSLAMEDLVTIGRTHQAMTQALLPHCTRRLFLDTDPLMTAVWADMLFGRRDAWFDSFDDTADLYLLLDLDMPWVDDGARFFGDPTQRQRFFDLAREELERRGLRYSVIGGSADERLSNALAAIAGAEL